jgi:riboflavin kinase/FMN adenylyltransferase
MKIYRSFDELSSPGRPLAVAIGNFDGLHFGHRKILGTLRREAARRRLPSSVLTFSPHPERMFGTRSILMIQTLEQRLEGFCRAGIDVAVVAPFDRRFAELAPQAFADRILRRALSAKIAVVGTGFRFGKDGEGSLKTLEDLGAAYGFEVRAVAPVRKYGHVVSSSRIRTLLRGGDVTEAAVLLGRPYAIEGDVVPGDRRGRSLGFPTANIETPNEIVPAGVFATLCEVGGRRRSSLTNVGVRPTFFRNAAPRGTARNGMVSAAAPSVETFILDFDRDVYGASVRVHFLKKIRDERVFAKRDELARQIGRDVQTARKYFTNMV